MGRLVDLDRRRRRHDRRLSEIAGDDGERDAPRAGSRRVVGLAFEDGRAGRPVDEVGSTRTGAMEVEPIVGHGSPVVGTIISRFPLDGERDRRVVGPFAGDR